MQAEASKAGWISHGAALGRWKLSLWGHSISGTARAQRTSYSIVLQLQYLHEEGLSPFDCRT